MKKFYKLEKYGNVYYVRFIKSKYLDNGNLYLGLVTDEEEPFADVTVNIEWMSSPEWACIDTNNLGEDILEWLVRIGAGDVMQGRSIISGYCRYPMFAFDEQFLEEAEELN